MECTYFLHVFPCAHSHTCRVSRCSGHVLPEDLQLSGAIKTCCTAQKNIIRQNTGMDVVSRHWLNAFVFIVCTSGLSNNILGVFLQMGFPRLGLELVTRSASSGSKMPGFS